MTKAPRRLRAYALTQGRTHSDADLPMDAMLDLGTNDAGARFSPEQRTIIAACGRAPQSLVDLSATLDMPLGVVRVLLSDLIDDGVVEISSHVDRMVPAHQDLALLEEVLDGIESL